MDEVCRPQRRVRPDLIGPTSENTATGEWLRLRRVHMSVPPSIIQGGGRRLRIHSGGHAIPATKDDLGDWQRPTPRPPMTPPQSILTFFTSFRLFSSEVLYVVITYLLPNEWLRDSWRYPTRAHPSFVWVPKVGVGHSALSVDLSVWPRSEVSRRIK